MRRLQFFAAFVLLPTAVWCNPVSLVSSYAGSYLIPGSGLTISDTVPFSTSYTVSQPINDLNYTGTYSASEFTQGTTTATQTNVSASYSAAPSGPPGRHPYSNFQYVSADSFSGANLQITGPVYLSESVTVSYQYSVSGLALAGSIENLNFYDGLGHALGTGCALSTGPGISSVQTASCSTGKVFVGSPSSVSIDNSLQGDAGAFGPGDAASFNATATLGPLDVYDTNGNLLEALDLSALQTSTPEPSCSILLGIGLLSFVTLRRHKHN